MKCAVKAVKDINSHVPRKHLERIHRVPCLSLQSTRRSKCRMDSQTDHLRGAHVDPCTCKHSTTISRNWGLSNRNETQSGKDSCTSCLMHRTRSCAHISHKDRVRKATAAAKGARWKKFSKDWIYLNKTWWKTVRRNMDRETKCGRCKRAN